MKKMTATAVGVVMIGGLTVAPAVASTGHAGDVNCRINETHPKVLRLTAASAGAQISVEPGDEYKVVSRWYHSKMTVPRALKSSTGTGCLLTVSRLKSGTVIALYVARDTGRVNYFSDKADPGATVDPDMHGTVLID